MYHDEVEVYPIWLCPAKAFDTGPVNALKDDSQDPIHIDIGLYGYSPKPDFKPYEALKNMEKWTRDHAGYQVTFLKFPQFLNLCVKVFILCDAICILFSHGFIQLLWTL